jgi:hypothetical protein
MSKELYLKYGPRNLFWLMDHFNDIHIRFSAELDREIDGARMEIAWQKTIEVYPVIGCVRNAVMLYVTNTAARNGTENVTAMS